MAQASVNLAKSRGSIEAAERSSTASSDQEDIDFKSLEEELYDQEISHILTNKHNPQKSFHSNEALNTPELEFEKGSSKGVHGSGREEKVEDSDESSSEDGGSDKQSHSSGSGSDSEGENYSDGVKREDSENDERQSVSDNDDDYRSINSDRDGRGKEGTEEENSAGSDLESDKNHTDDEEETKEGKEIIDEKEDDEIEEKEDDTLPVLDSKYDPISSDEESMGSMDNEDREPPKLTESMMYEPVSDDEEDEDDTEQVDQDGKQDDTRKEDNKKLTEDKSELNRRNCVENGEEDLSRDGSVSSKGSDSQDSASHGSRINDVSGLIVADVYSLQDSAQIEKDDDNCDEQTENGKTRSVMSVIEQSIEKDLDDSGVGDIPKAKTMSKRSLQKKKAREMQTRDETFPDIEIKEEPIDYDEYASMDYTEFEHDAIEEELSKEYPGIASAFKGEFEYMDGTVASLGTPKKEKSSSPKKAPKELMYELLEEDGSLVYRCKQCSCKFYHYAKYEFHRKKHHSKKYKCKHCDQEFERSQILAIHVRVKHVIDSFVKKKDRRSESQGQIRTFSIEDKKRKHSSGLYGSQIVDTGIDAHGENYKDYYDDFESPPRKKKKKRVSYTYIDSEGHKVNKVSSRKKKSSSVVVDGVLMYKCAYCSTLFEKQQSMACHVRNSHILEKNDRDRLTYQRHGKFKNKKKKTKPDESIESQELDYAVNEDGDLEVLQPEEGVGEMYVNSLTNGSDAPNNELHSIQSVSQSPPKKRKTKVSKNSEAQDEALTQLQEEFNIQIDSKIYTCDHCTKWFFRKPDLDLHMQKHIRNNFEDVKQKEKDEGDELEESFKLESFCKYCPSKFESVNKLKMHIVRHLGEVIISDNYNEKRFQCRVCGEGTNDSKLMRKHLRTHFSKEIDEMDPHSLIDCSFCGLPFLTHERKDIHEKIHADFLQEKAWKKKLKKVTVSSVSNSSSVVSSGPKLVSLLDKKPKVLDNSVSEKRSECLDKKSSSQPATEAEATTTSTTGTAVNETMTDKVNKSLEETKVPLADVLGEQVKRALELSSEVDTIDRTRKTEKEDKTDSSKAATGKSTISDKERDLLVKSLFRIIPFECGMCKSRFPNSQYLLHHMTLHMKGKYVFRVDQDATKEEKEKPKPPSQKLSPIVANPNVSMPGFTKLNHFVQEKFTRTVQNPIIRPLPSVISSPTILPASSPARLPAASSILVRKVTPQAAPTAPSVPMRPVLIPSPMQAPNVGTAPIILQPNVRGQPYYLVTNPSQQNAKQISLIPAPRPTFSIPQPQPNLLYSPMSQSSNLSMGGKPLISIITPTQYQSKSKPTVPVPGAKITTQPAILQKADPPPQRNSMLRSLINQKQLEQQRQQRQKQEEQNKKKALQDEKQKSVSEDLPDIDSDEDLMNCSSPDSVLGMASDSENETSETDVKLNGSTDVSALVDNPQEDDKVAGQIMEFDEKAPEQSTKPIGAKQTVSFLKKKYVSKTVKRLGKPVVGKKVAGDSSTRRSRNRKLIRFADGQWYECNLCMSKFGSIVEYKKHIKVGHRGIKRERLHKCNMCGKKFLTKYHLEKHRATHRNNEYQCSVCDEAFMTSQEIVSHMIEVHPSQ